MARVRVEARVRLGDEVSLSLMVCIPVGVMDVALQKPRWACPHRRRPWPLRAPHWAHCRRSLSAPIR